MSDDPTLAELVEALDQATDASHHATLAARDAWEHWQLAEAEARRALEAWQAACQAYEHGKANPRPVTP